MLKKKAVILAAVLVVVMLTPAFFTVSVEANPITVTVSPTSGPVGASATVSGSNATAEGEVRVYVGVFLVGFFASTTTANSTGGYSVNFTVPAIPAGLYSVAVVDVETGDTESIDFTIEPKILLTPEEGSCNDKVKVNGYGFDSETSISLTLDGTDVTPIPQPETDPFGSFETEFSIPSVPNGTYNFTANDGINEASAPLTVIPKITLIPTSGSPATLVFVNGTGFTPFVGVSIEFDAINVTMIPTFPTEADGSFIQLFLVPDVPNGAYTVEATDENGTSATAPFHVPSPVMTLTPNTTSGPAIVTATGSGFLPKQPILLYLEDIFSVNLIDLMTGNRKLLADEYGSYEYSFVVPVGKPGVYPVIAYSLAEGDGLVVGEALASASLTVVEGDLLVKIKDEIDTIVIPDLDTIKANLTNIGARIVSLNGTVATIETKLGIIEADLIDINAKLVSIDGNVATIKTDVGAIETDVNNIKARLVNIDGNVATIETDIGTIETDLADINARLVSIDGNVATIETDIGTIQTDIEAIESDVNDVKGEVVPTGYEFGLLATILALIAAAGAWLSVIITRKKSQVPTQIVTPTKPKPITPTKPKPKKQ